MKSHTLLCLSIILLGAFAQDGQAKANKAISNINYKDIDENHELFNFIFLHSSFHNCTFQNCTFELFNLEKGCEVENSLVLGTKFDYLYVSESKFGSIYIEDSMSYHSDFYKCEIQNISIVDSHFYYTQLSMCTITNIIFQDSLVQFDTSRVTFKSNNFTNVSLPVSGFYQTNFLNSHFDSVDLESSYFQFTIFHESSFTSVNFEYASLYDVIIDGDIDWDTVSFYNACFHNLIINGRKIQDHEYFEGDFQKEYNQAPLVPNYDALLKELLEKGIFNEDSVSPLIEDQPEYFQDEEEEFEGFEDVVPPVLPPETPVVFPPETLQLIEKIKDTIGPEALSQIEELLKNHQGSLSLNQIQIAGDN